MRSIVLDEFYLYPFLSSGIKAGILKKTDYGSELNDIIPNYNKYIQRVHELLFLYDKVTFNCDFGTLGGYKIVDYKPFPSMTVPTRIVPVFEPEREVPLIDSSQNRLEYMKEKFPEYCETADICYNKYGIEVVDPIRWASLESYANKIKENIEKKPEEREFPEFLELAFEKGLFTKYLKRKWPDIKHIPVKLFRFYTFLYKKVPIDNILEVMRMSPFYQDDKMSIEQFSFLLSHAYYTSEQLDFYLGISQQAGSDLSLAYSASFNNTQAATKVVRVLLNEICNEPLILPRAKTLDDVLKIRYDSRMKDFREVLWQWTEEIVDGNLNYSKKLLKEIQLANKEIKKLGDYNKMSNWITFTSLPVSIAELLIGFPVLGSLLTVTGFSVKMFELAKKKKHGWLLLLNNN